jgi:NAD(P)-dependent dehydrogenase (short-subunit alcohol dehydrogenase family)
LIPGGRDFGRIEDGDRDRGLAGHRGRHLVAALLERGYRVVANSRSITKKGTFAESGQLALVDGDIGEPSTAARVVETAVERFGSVDALVNNAGIFSSKAFTDYTAEDFRSLVSTNLEGFLHVTQHAIRRMLAQKAGGSIVTVTASLADKPIAGLPAAVPMITKGGLNSVTRSLALEYAKDGIRVNAVAPGVVDTPLLKGAQQGFLKALSPMGQVADVRDVADAVLYLLEASRVTGEVLHVDGGAHSGKW